MCGPPGGVNVLFRVPSPAASPLKGCRQLAKRFELIKQLNADYLECTDLIDLQQTDQVCACVRVSHGFVRASVRVCVSFMDFACVVCVSWHMRIIFCFAGRINIFIPLKYFYKSHDKSIQLL